MEHATRGIEAIFSRRGVALNEPIPIEILLVEDSPSDRFLAEIALKDASFPTRVHSVSDGVDAMQFLRREGSYRTAPRPDIILLDLNLPRKSGREVLAETKTDRALSSIPIIVLTTSTLESDVAMAYELHANCLIAKPIDFESFRRVVGTISNFWFNTVKLPPKDA